MGDERLQTISLRVPEETYEKLKKYAEEHGSSVSDVVRGLIDGLLSGAPGPSPAPGPPTQEPEPSPAPNPTPEPAPQPVTIPTEILELPEKVKAMMQYEIEMRDYVGKMACRVGELQQEVKKLLMVVFPFMPLPPWAVMSAFENPVIQELEKLAEKYYSDGA
jgi:hypothetical protein